ncbi:MAG: hypothetical protein PUC06_00500 [Oscillospiraceae bacterium]|nr:hypothetical protein [Oscillospiraceae bacterium]
MLKISGLRLSPGQPESALTKKAQRELGTEIKGFVVLKKSVDARKKDDIALVYTIGVKVPHEQQVLKKCRSKKVSFYEETSYCFPVQHLRLGQRPVIVGTGPAGLFCGLMLARIGARPILLERGLDVDRRTELVEHFWSTGELDTGCNVQFGEGGAGTFSDGKLNTGVNDPRMRFILEQFAAFGAPREILSDAAPHVGTDYLKTVVKNIREELCRLGGEVRFGHQLTGIRMENGAVSGAEVLGPDGSYVLETKHLVLAIGHSARDTVTKLYEQGVPMEPKQFAVGVRIEHLQKTMTLAQYGAEIGGLPVASYKLSCHLEGGRSAFSFCVCPGGMVVAAASEEGRVCTNGMSNQARDEVNINGGLLVTVRPEDFGSEHPLAGIDFQRRLEEAAFKAGGGGYKAPCQRVGDFLRGVPSVGPGTIQPSYRPGVTYTDLHSCLPEFITQTLEQALPVLGKKIKGYDDPNALLTAVEARSSSPVRIPRDSSGQSSISGLYPCGEGAGYAGGIMSAAADGIRVAEWICASI